MMKKFLCVLLIFLLPLPSLTETVQDQALAFIQEAGIAADSVMRIGDEIIVTLADGGTAILLCPGDFDKYDLAWRFTDAPDEAVGLYLDHALSLLAGLEAKIAAADERRAENYAVMVSGALLDLENLGQQGLDILLEKLSAHDSSELNSLRERLAQQLTQKLAPAPTAAAAAE